MSVILAHELGNIFLFVNECYKVFFSQTSLIVFKFNFFLLKLNIIIIN